MTDDHYEFIKQRLAPCGLHCGRCFAFAGGQIHALSSQLQTALGNFEVFAKRFVDLLNDPIYGKYPEFKEVLDHLAKAAVAGAAMKNASRSRRAASVRAPRSRRWISASSVRISLRQDGF